VPILRDFHCSPVEFWQGRDQAGYHAGFAYIPRMSADHD